MLSLIKSVWRRPLFRLLMSLSILAILIGRMPLEDLWITVKSVSPSLWVFVVVAFLLGHSLGVAKWCLFINMGQNKLPFLAAFQCYFAGLFANLFLPSIAGGDVVRAGLAIRYKGDKEGVIFGSLLDRCVDVSALALIIFLGGLYYPGFLTLEDRMILLSVLLLILVFVLSIFLILVLPVPKIVPERLGGLIERLRDIIKELIRNPKRALAGFGMALVIQSGFVVLNAMLGRGCQIDLPLHIWFIAWPLAKLSAMLPISLGGLGVREMALAVLLDRFNVPLARSVGLGLLWESVLVAGGGVGGVLYLIAKRNVPKSALVVEKRVAYKGKVAV